MTIHIERRLTITFLLLLGALTSTPAQERPVITSRILDKGVSLAFQVTGVKYQRGNTVIVRYRVENKSKQNINLVVREDVLPGISPENRELFINLDRSVLTYHEFQLPKLEKIKPNGSYEGETKLSLDFLKNKFTAGEWLLYLSIGYLNDQDLAEMRNHLGIPGLLAQDFEKRQKTLLAGPIRLELYE